MDKLILTNPYKHFKKNYGKVGNKVTVMAPKKLYQFYNRKIKMKDIYKFLETTESYSLLKYEQSIKTLIKQ